MKIFKRPVYDLLSMHKVCQYVIENAYGRPEFKKYDWDLLDSCERLAAFFHFASNSQQHHKLVTSYLNLRIIDALNTIDKPGQAKLVSLHGHAGTIATFLNNFFPDNYKCILKKLRPEKT